MAPASSALRDLRGLRYDPPGYAKQGARRATFQSALEQCEQFLTAARDADYATRPVQLFYALSQAGRAIVAASPHIGNQARRVSGHGLTADTSAGSAADVTVTATKTGLFRSVAEALNIEPLTPGEPTELRELWPLIPDTAFVPLTADAMTPVLLFSPRGWPVTVFSEARVDWIPHGVKEQYGDDPARVKEHLDRYPALKKSRLLLSGLRGRVEWESAGPGLGLSVEWRSSVELDRVSPPLMFRDKETLSDLGVMSFRAPGDFVITPSIGSMSTGLHPILALWGVLLALSSLARYEPATWSNMIDINRSAEANAIEYLLDDVISSVPAATHHLLCTFE